MRNRKILLCALQQICTDATAYFNKQSACNFYSDAASENSFALIKRYARVKQYFHISTSRLEIDHDIIKPLGIYNGSDLRSAIEEANTLFPNGAGKFRMTSEKVSKKDNITEE